jgi:hypothetical protein
MKAPPSYCVVVLRVHVRVRACGIGNHDANVKNPFQEMFAFLLIGLVSQIGQYDIIVPTKSCGCR